MKYYDSAPEVEAAYDRLDDQGQSTAAEIREETGYEPDGTNEDFTVDAIEARLGRVTMPDEARQAWLDSFHLTHPSSDGPFRHATPEERNFATDNMNKVRAALRKEK